MVSFIANLLLGTLMGFLAGMGVGGGSLLLLWLTQVAMLEHEQARIINLLFFLPAAAVSTLFQKKHGKIEKRPAIAATIAGCSAAIIFSFISKAIDVTLLKKMFGMLLILTGIREICYRPRKAK